MTYTWDCKTVDTYPSQGDLNDVVYNVHWRMIAEKDGVSATIIGTQSLTVEDVDAEDFIEFEDLTHEQVIEWVESAMGEDRVQEIKDAAKAQLEDLIAPKSVTKHISE